MDAKARDVLIEILERAEEIAVDYEAHLKIRKFIGKAKRSLKGEREFENVRQADSHNNGNTRV